MRKLEPLVAVAALALVSACGRRVPLAYDYPGPRLTAAGPLVVCHALQDRRSDRSIDDALTEENAVPAVERAVRDELASAGIADQVVARAAPEPLPADRPTFVVEPVLEELAWEVPGYQRIWTTTLIVSVLSGGIGGLIYGLTPTDVLGNARLTIRMVDARTKRELTKSYVGSWRERMAKVSSDSKSTRSKAAGKALHSALQEFRADAANFAASAQ